ncbi:MAG: serine protease [Candidatus Microsaccharimonas sp.]
MIKSKFFYRLYKAAGQKPSYYLGTAFPIAPGGTLMTCRHVVDVSFEKDEYLAVFDEESKKLFPVGEVNYPKDPNLDIAILPNAFNDKRKEYIPFLSPYDLKVGEDVYSMGFFNEHENNVTTQDGYFGGKIVNFRNAIHSEHAALTLPFAIIEGLSGSPILTYHNGVKVVGMAIGSKSARVVASEVIEYEDEKLQLKETISRIIEFGIAYHVDTLINATKEMKVKNVTVSSDSVEIPNL